MHARFGSDRGSERPVCPTGTGLRGVSMGQEREGRKERRKKREIGGGGGSCLTPKPLSTLFALQPRRGGGRRGRGTTFFTEPCAFNCYFNENSPTARPLSLKRARLCARVQILPRFFSLPPETRNVRRVLEFLRVSLSLLSLSLSLSFFLSFSFPLPSVVACFLPNANDARLPTHIHTHTHTHTHTRCGGGALKRFDTSARCVRYTGERKREEEPRPEFLFLSFVLSCFSS